MEREQDKILLVEGTGDKGVFTELLKAWGIQCPLIKDCGSVEDVFRMMRLCLTNSGQYKYVGVVVDADTHPEGRLHRFLQIAAKSGRYNINGCMHLQSEGLVAEGLDVDAARIGLWVMPDNRDHGMLEDFLAKMAATVSPELLDEAESALVRVEKQGIQQYTPVHRPKAKMHTYLAWQKEPGAALPVAIMKHYLDASSDNARPFISWINRLFGR